MKTKKSFKYWQWRVIICSMIGYSMFYFVRKNFSFAMPSLGEEYGITNTSFGVILSLVGILYGVSKFVNGFIADRFNARWHMVIGLTACVILNFLFGWSDRISTWITGQASGPDFVGGMVVVMAVLLVLNNLFQGCGFPPCNRLLVHWVPPRELATKTAVWNTSHSIGAGILAVLCGYIIAATDNWRMCFWIPGAIAAAGIFFILFTLADTPSSVGLPELPDTKTEIDDDLSPQAYRAFLRKHVLLNPVIWVLAVTDLFVYVVRFAILDWGPTFLSHMAVPLSPQLAGWTIGIFEVAGCLGMIAAGYISDKFFKSRSQRVCVIEMALVAICLVALHYIQDMNTPVLFLFVLALAGFFLYGPQALLGVVASNEVSKKAASSAVGIIGFMSYLSTLITGLPLGLFADKFGWHPIFILMAGVSMIGFILIVTLWNLRDRAHNTTE